MDIKCTERRIESKKLLIKETNAYCNYISENNCITSWNFTEKNADEKLAKYYA
ncbi:MAG: hypothetical protein LBB45_04470 [Methanobrevibacter sp.]|jgi:hypothetical protein|nr:hypothetical protein [Candidatus Methanovirga basalitermitum]